MYQTEFVDIITTHLLCSLTPPPPEHRAIYEVMCKNCVDPDRPQMTIWRMYIARRITNAINTLSEYVILIAFPLQQWLHERASVLRYMHTDWLTSTQNGSQQFDSYSGRFTSREKASVPIDYEAG
jgi:hypothetical protein